MRRCGWSRVAFPVDMARIFPMRMRIRMIITAIGMAMLPVRAFTWRTGMALVRVMRMLQRLIVGRFSFSSVVAMLASVAIPFLSGMAVI